MKLSKQSRNRSLYLYIMGKPCRHAGMSILYFDYCGISWAYKLACIAATPLFIPLMATLLFLFLSIMRLIITPFIIITKRTTQNHANGTYHSDEKNSDNAILYF